MVLIYIFNLLIPNIKLYFNNSINFKSEYIIRRKKKLGRGAIGLKN